MLVKKEDIAEYIPQKHPMIMVDGLLEQSEDSTTSCLQLETENIFCQNGYFTEAGLIENIAQTAALRSGYEAHIKNEKPTIGFIGALKRIKIHKLPLDNESLKTTIKIQHNLMNVLVIHGEVFSNGELMAHGEMNIFLQE